MLNSPKRIQYAAATDLGIQKRERRHPTERHIGGLKPVQRGVSALENY